MATFEYITVVKTDPLSVFEFLVAPKNLLLIMPPSPKIDLLDVPDRLQMGSRFTARVSKWCFHSTSTSEITWFEEGCGFTDVQRKGIFRRFEHTHTVEPHSQGTLMRDRIEIEPPGFPLNLVLTERRLQRELNSTFEFRAKRLAKVFA